MRKFTCNRGVLRLSALLAAISAVLAVPTRARADCIDDTPCDDGSACTENDRCIEGTCAGTPLNCDDGNPCTADTCDPQTGCVHVGTRTIADENRRLFYNNSWYDSAVPGGTIGSPSANCNNYVNGGNPCNDNTAIATDKAALNPGGTATTANYINYSRGINGMMIDVTPGPDCGPLPAGPLAASNFEFKVGTRSNLGQYMTAAAPLSIDVIPGGGAAGSDRIRIIWANNAMPNRNWLRVTVKSNASGGQLDLAADNIFYFGLAIGDEFQPTTPGSRVQVNASEEVGARNNPHSTFSRVQVASNSTYGNPANLPPVRYDFDKSSTVNVADEIVPRNNPSNFFNGLLMMNPAP